MLPTGLEEGNVELEEIGTSEVDGVEAKSFVTPPLGQMWVVEHPDRGLLVITADAFTDPDAVFPPILA